jgi:hypothetical protein
MAFRKRCVGTTVVPTHSGLHEAMDQIGAILGPLIVAGILYFNGGYRISFAILLIPALVALAVLLVARILYPRPRDLEVASVELTAGGFSRIFWLYLAAVSLVAAGYADFPLISFHFEKLSLVPKVWIPVFYAVAMGVDALLALFFGRLFDRIGLSILIIVSLISSFFAPLVFLGGFSLALLGMAIWGGRHGRSRINHEGCNCGNGPDKQAEYSLWDFQRRIRTLLVLG